MDTVRLQDAVAYTATKHHLCSSFRLQGLEVTDSSTFWVGLSHFLPGGGAEMEASPFEKVYVVTAGEITVAAGERTDVLRVNDSCLIPAFEAREVRNDSHLPASMIVIISKIPGERT